MLGALRVSRNAPKVLSGKDLFGTTRDDGGIGKDVGGGGAICVGKDAMWKRPI